METLEPNLVGFSFLFSVVYFFGYFIIFKDWKEKVRCDASSCIMSLAHGTPATILSIYSMLQYSHTSFQNHSPFQEMILEYSIAYFLADLLHYLVFYPTDVLFIAHRLATLCLFNLSVYHLSWCTHPYWPSCSS